MSARTGGVVVLALLGLGPAAAGSLQLLQNAPTDYDFVDIASLPAEFGRGEFTFELWLRPDASKPVGPTWRASYAQLSHWSDADPEPYASPGWWLPGNWLLDGHTRPRGFGPNDTREGTFSLQFYGGGRVRFMFADGDLDLPGKVWAVQAWPAASTPSLLDGQWHHVAVLRRWREPAGARLELWIDGEPIAHTDIPERVDMRRWWDALAHPDDPPELGGWALGAEVMTAWNWTFTQYEDYKGHVDEIRLWSRALDADELARHWREAVPADAPGLLAHYGFDEGRDTRIGNRLDRDAHALRLHKPKDDSWSADDAPLAPPDPRRFAR